MFKKKFDQKKQTKIALALASVSLVINLILGFILFNDNQIAKVVDISNINNMMENHYLTSRITFCYDNNIHPCDHDQLSAWNKAHPDNPMALKAGKIKESDF